MIKPGPHMTQLKFLLMLRNLKYKRLDVSNVQYFQQRNNPHSIFILPNGSVQSNIAAAKPCASVDDEAVVALTPPPPPLSHKGSSCANRIFRLNLEEAVTRRQHGGKRRRFDKVDDAQKVAAEAAMEVGGHILQQQQPSQEVLNLLKF